MSGGGKQMLYTKRNEFEIICEILIYANKKIKKTRLMYQTNMCYNHFNEYLKFLLEKKLLAENASDQDGSVYITTEKGKKILEKITLVIEEI